MSSKEVGKNIKDKKRDKRGRDGAPSQEGSLKKRKVSKHPGNTLAAESVVSLGSKVLANPDSILKSREPDSPKVVED